MAFYLINQKLTKGIDPPQALTPEMIPPSDRGVSLQKVRRFWYKSQRMLVSKAAQETPRVLAYLKVIIISRKMKVNYKELTKHCSIHVSK